MFRAFIVSFFLSLQASFKLKKATRALGKEEYQRAYRYAMDGLTIMNNPKVSKENTSEQSITLHLTFIADSLSKKLNSDRPHDTHYRVAYKFVKSLEGQPVFDRYESWIKRIEAMDLV